MSKKKKTYTPHPAKNVEDLRRQLYDIEQDLNAHQRALVQKLEVVLQGLPTIKVDEYWLADHIARELQFVAGRLQALIRCPKEGCDGLARIRCRQPERVEFIYQFEHPISDWSGSGPKKYTTHWGRPDLPALKLVFNPDEVFLPEELEKKLRDS